MHCKCNLELASARHAKAGKRQVRLPRVRSTWVNCGKTSSIGSLGLGVYDCPGGHSDAMQVRAQVLLTAFALLDAFLPPWPPVHLGAWASSVPDLRSTYRLRTAPGAQVYHVTPRAVHTWEGSPQFQDSQFAAPAHSSELAPE